MLMLSGSRLLEAPEEDGSDVDSARHLVCQPAGKQSRGAEEGARYSQALHSVHRGIDTIGPDKENFSRTVSSRSL